MAPPPVTEAPHGLRVAVLIPTYDEPAEVIASPVVQQAYLGLAAVEEAA